MDVLLANAYMLALDAEEQRIMRPHPPLGVLYLSSHLKARGFDVGVFDGTFRSLEGFADRLQRDRPRVVGLAVNPDDAVLPGTDRRQPDDETQCPRDDRAGAPARGPRRDRRA